MSKTLPPKHSLNQALRIIKENLKNGETIPTKHFKERLIQRDLTMRDVINILQYGIIYNEPELDIKLNQWKYRVSGKTI